MIKIMGSELFATYEEAKKYYTKLDRAGYNVELSTMPGNRYSVSFLGWIEEPPLEGVIR